MSETRPVIYLASRRDTQLVTQDDRFIRKFLKYNSGHDRANITDLPDKADFIILFQDWSFKLSNYAATLAADPFIQTYANNTYVINYDDVVGEGFLPGCYVSLRNSRHDTRRFRACAYPKTYNEFVSNTIDYQTPYKYLYSFRGSLGSHPVRPIVYDSVKDVKDACIVDNSREFHTHTEEDKKIYVTELTQSLFVLCPRGSSPSSYRLFETMSLGRCPVIISDEWVEIDGPDWDQCSIRVPERDIPRIDSILRERENEGVALGKNARNEWEAHFTEPLVYQNYLDNILDLYTSEFQATKSIDQYRRYWKSHRFLKNNNWTLAQKIMRRLRW